MSTILDGNQPPARDWHYGGMFNRYFVRTDEWVLLGDNLGGNRELCDLNLDRKIAIARKRIGWRDPQRN